MRRDFAESIVAGVTPVRALHVQELRTAIDALRSTAGLSPYGPPAVTEGWPDHSPPVGLIFSIQVGAMRRALDAAIFALNGGHITTANPIGPILASDFNQLREALR